MKKSDNICNYYLLPLLKLNKFSFGPGAFENCYLADNYQLVVKLNKSYDIASRHYAFSLSYEDDGYHYIVYDLPEEFHDTVDKFKEGKYSTFVKAHKDLIRKYSGLNYKQPIARKSFVTARQLLALDREQPLRDLLEKELGISLPEDAELISIPNEECFITIPELEGNYNINS